LQERRFLGGKIYSYLANDHARLDGALRLATRDPNRIDRAAYAEFREGLLRHIGMEEKILLPAARSANGGKPLASVDKLHLDHGALAALLVPTPTSAIIAAIKTILDGHNPLEEGPGGVYEECERLLGTGADEIVLRLQSAPRVAMAPTLITLLLLNLHATLSGGPHTMSPCKPGLNATAIYRGRDMKHTGSGQPRLGMTL